MFGDKTIKRTRAIISDWFLKKANQSRERELITVIEKLEGEQESVVLELSQVDTGANSQKEHIAQQSSQLVVISAEKKILQESLVASEKKLAATVQFMAASERKVKLLSQMVAVMEKANVEALEKTDVGTF